MAETIVDQLAEAVSALPDDAECSLFCGPDVYHAVLASDGPSVILESPHRIDVNLVFTMDAKAWRLEHAGEPVADGTMEEQ